MKKTALSQRTAVVVDDEPLPHTHLAYLLKSPRTCFRWEPLISAFSSTAR